MKRMLLKISYDGTAYHGWQVQPNGITVQQVLQNTLNKMLGVPTSVTGCSRTDAGVHAREFYCHFECEENIPEKAFKLGLDSMLPNDISVSDCITVANNFHSRYNALGKEYEYNMYLGKRDPFLSRYALKLDTPPDLELMGRFCKSIVGKHDFYGFSSSGRTVEDTVRTVTGCTVEQVDNIIRFNISANGFLYNMVRILAGTALDVSYGRLSVECANDVFESKNRSLAGKTLPPQGLFLKKFFIKIRILEVQNKCLIIEKRSTAAVMEIRAVTTFEIIRI